MSERTYVIFGILCLIISALTFTYITENNYFAIEGYKLDAINAQIAKYKKENALLEVELLHKEAYTTIYDEARKQGFVPAQPFFLK